VELDELEVSILKSLLFTESFERIVEECTTTKDKNIVADGLKSLLKHKLVRPMYLKNGEFVASIVYDSDKMYAFQYQATAKGISWMEENQLS
jgi:hypothetical protein